MKNGLFKNFRNWSVSSYNEDTPEQIDYYMNEYCCHAGNTAYLYLHETQELIKMEIIHMIQRSNDCAYYDGLCDTVLTDVETSLNADTSAEFITDNDSYLVWFRYREDNQSLKGLLFREILFEEQYSDEANGTTTFYFTAPKQLLKLLLPECQYPDAISMEISLEFPTEHIETAYASVSIAPTKEVKGGTEDYDWHDIELPYADIQCLMALSEIRFASVEQVDTFTDFIVFWCELEHLPKPLVDKAENIDKDNYSPECFGICVTLDKDGFHITADEPGCQLYYIDNLGKKHWFSWQLSSIESSSVYEGCLLELLANLSL